jgi:hypothetical protein
MDQIITKLQTLIVTVAALIEAAVHKLPMRILVNGRARTISPRREVAVVSVTLTTAGQVVTGRFSRKDDVVIDYITAYTADTAGLNGFRVQLQDQHEQKLFAFLDHPDGTLVRPLASQVLPSSSNNLADRPSMMMYWPANQDLYLVAEDGTGTTSYTVEFCVHYRAVLPAA